MIKALLEFKGNQTGAEQTDGQSDWNWQAGTVTGREQRDEHFATDRDKTELSLAA